MKFTLIVVCFVALSYCLAADYPGCQHYTCTECIRHPTCIWCSKNNTETRFPSCISEKHPDYENWLTWCETEVVEPEFIFTVIKEEPLSSDDDAENIVQMKPQEINLTLGIQTPYNITLTYSHSDNYPADIYYMMDGSKSMADDKDMLYTLGEKLAEGMKEITSNLQLGFGIFIDKPVLPYITTIPVTGGETPAYSFKNALPLTSNASAFTEEVERAKGATNQDFPEGGFDGLMQAIVCEEKIRWRNTSFRVIIFSTDAGFHLAGDGKLAGILRPNDKQCHLDNNNEYNKAIEYDYPSVAQINEMAKIHRINLVFAITAEQEPLYARLSQHIEGASSGVLASDSSNVVDLLTSSLKDIISKVDLTERDHNAHVSVRYFSECKDGEMKERSSCQGLVAGDEVQFLVEVTATKCPDNEKDWNPVIDVYPVGRQGSLQINLAMHCQCTCDKPGDKGYIANADECNRSGDFKCGVCECHEGFLGKSCECNDVDSTGTISEDTCRQTNTSAICSNRGQCKCGQCHCNVPTDSNQKIYGDFCECTNYQECVGDGGLTCSGHGTCECNECQCDDGWSGSLCSCDEADDKCKNPDMDEICSGHGTCTCNKCTCRGDYTGKYCEDCPTCKGKCTEYIPCVRCHAFQTGAYDASECETNCAQYNITLHETLEVDSEKEKRCTFLDDNCILIFAYTPGSAGGRTTIRVQTEKECTAPVNILAVILGVIGGVLLIGILTLIIWRVFASIQDRREYSKFILSRNDEKWSNNENPLYKQATTTVQNPVFGMNN
ncbi:integrin beta-PS-like [Penaeus indicus]|uniref:integrin beta-PS-like n=1 Tax=Penaeus indicus TaxID=29960 RepID=UPI00300D5EF2